MTLLQNVPLYPFNFVAQAKPEFVSKHPASQIPASYYDPPQKAAQQKAPPLEDFFPPAKADVPKRRPVPAPRAPYDPPKEEEKKEPKKELMKVFDNMPKQKPKHSINDLNTKKGYDFGAKETIPYHLKNTNQKAIALDAVNQLIGQVTDLSHLDQPQQRKIQNVDTDDLDDEDVYGLPQERDEAYERFKQESRGTGIVMSFDDEKQASKKKPMLSSMKKKKSEQNKPKQRSQWKKNNHSVLEPAPKVEDVVSQDLRMNRKESEKTKQDIIETRRKMREDMKKNKKKKDKFEGILVEDDNSDNGYTPTIMEKPSINKQPPLKSAPQSEPLPKAPSKTADNTKRVKKEWTKNPKPDIKPVEDHSTERKEWKRPSPMPKEKKEPKETFEVITVDQDDTSVNSQPPVYTPPVYTSPVVATQGGMQFTSQLDKDHFQFDRMLADMKNNLLSDLLD